MDLINTLLIKKELDLIAWEAVAPRLRAPVGELLIRSKAILIVLYRHLNLKAQREGTDLCMGWHEDWEWWQHQSKQAFSHILNLYYIIQHL